MTIPTTLIGSLGEEDLQAIPQDRSAIIQVENPNLALLYLSRLSFVGELNHS